MSFSMEVRDAVSNWTPGVGDLPCDARSYVSGGGVSAASTPAENLPLSQIAALAPQVLTSADETIPRFGAVPLDGKLAAQSHDAVPALAPVPESPAAGAPARARPFASLRASSERSEGIGLSLSFNDRRAPQGRVLTGTLSVIPPAGGDAGKTFDVAIDLPPGLDFVASADKGVTYDAAQRAVIMTCWTEARPASAGASSRWLWEAQRPCRR